MNREQIIAIYEKAAQNPPREGQDVAEADCEVNSAIINYTAAIQKETFIWAYKLGYMHGEAAVNDS